MNYEVPQILFHDHDFARKPRTGIPYLAIRHMGAANEKAPLSNEMMQSTGVKIPHGLFFGQNSGCNPQQSNFVQVSTAEVGFFISTKSLADCGNFKRVRGGGQNIVLAYDFPRDAPTNIWRRAQNKLLIEVSAKVPTHNIVEDTWNGNSVAPIAQMSLIFSLSSTSRRSAQALRYVIPFFDSRGITSNRIMSDYEGAFFISSSISGDQYVEGDFKQKQVQNAKLRDYKHFRATVSAAGINNAIRDLNDAIDQNNQIKKTDAPKVATDITELKLESVGILVEILFDFGASGPRPESDISNWGHLQLGGAIKGLRVAEIAPSGDSNAKAVPIYSHYSPIIRDHFYSRIEGEPVRLGYLREGIAFYVYPEPIPSSQKLFRCVINKHHFLSTEKDCAGGELDDTLGWVRSAQDASGSWTQLLACSRRMHQFVVASFEGCERGFDTKSMDVFVRLSPRNKQ